MTDHPTPTDDDLSLALDGEADAELLARIEADPAARARLEQLRAAADLVAGAPVDPLDDDVVDGLIRAALDEPLAPVAGDRAAVDRHRRATPWLVAASVVVLMAIGLSLIWAGRSTDSGEAASTAPDSAEVAKSGAGGGADSSFSSGGSTAESAGDVLAGGHGSPTTVPGASATRTSAADLPVLYLGTYADADALRDATATSFADAWKASGSPLAFDSDTPPTSGDGNARRAQAPPSDAAIDRCANQLQITLSMPAAPLQTGYATVDDDPVLVYEFAAASARDGKETTLVAAVGVDACDEVVIFER